MSERFLTQFNAANEILIDFGWIVSPFMIQKDFNKVFDLAQKIKEEDNEEDRIRIAESINRLLSDIIFHPLFRSFSVYRAQNLSHLNKFSHHIERAILHYYKEDYFSAVHCLVPAVEGVLLSYFGWIYESGKRKPRIDLLIMELEKCREDTFDSDAYETYSRILSLFLRKWIFSDTNTADVRLSFLNRHYVTHGMGNQNYYSVSDVHQLFMFFDLFVEFVSIEENQTYIFIPDDNPEINKRSDYYFLLIEGNLFKDKMLQEESELMSSNTSFVFEETKPIWRDILQRTIKEDLEFLIELKKKFKKDANGR